MCVSLCVSASIFTLHNKITQTLHLKLRPRLRPRPRLRVVPPLFPLRALLSHGCQGSTPFVCTSYFPLIDSHEGTSIPARCAPHSALAALVEGHRLGAHEIEVCADAGASRVGRDHAAGVTKSSFNGQRILLAAANGRAMWGQGRGCAENGDQTAMVIGRHLQRQIGDHEQRIEQIIDAIILPGRTLYECAAIVLASYVAHDLVQLHGSVGEELRD